MRHAARSLFSAFALSAAGILTHSLTQAAPPPPAPRDTAAGELQTITASVIHGTKDIFTQAELQPGPFTVPQGYVATKFEYHWVDPKTDLKNDRMTASTIYSMAEHRYLTEAKNNPDLVLKAGDYKLVCGGLPGAAGVLTYRLFKADAVRDEKPRPGERIIDVETWVTDPAIKNYNPKFKATYFVRDGKVTGKIDQLVEAPKYDNGIWCDPMPTKGTFTGEFRDNTIRGTWEIKIAPHKMHFPPHADAGAHERTDWNTMTYEATIALKADGTLAETCKGTGVSNWEWSATSPSGIAGKRDTHKFDITIPGEHCKEPMTGSWTERK